eukprot:TRINITY_DN6283_c0_g1_i1.p1 TRINITY_DN6283_c0_g1~~TRINITY_DN6283_c0_g1_i1.p1  ORF type:complete len:254 (+),score=48.77 TRINITY_DN6283_c0_g1_i1:61-822(+)
MQHDAAGNIAVEVKELDGTAYKVSVPRGAKVEELRAEVFKAGGPPPVLQRLMWKGSPLVDGRCVGECGVGDGARVHLVRNKPQDRPQVVGKLAATGRIVVVCFSREGCRTVGALKEEIVKSAGDLADVKMYLEGSPDELLDEKPLSDYGLQEGGTVRLTSAPQASTDTVPTPTPPHGIHPDLHRFLTEHSLTDYAPVLSQAGIRSLPLLQLCQPSDLPTSLPKPVQRLLVSQMTNCAETTPSAPPAPSAPCHV